jgi:hypothetical protein
MSGMKVAGYIIRLIGLWLIFGCVLRYAPLFSTAFWLTVAGVVLVIIGSVTIDVAIIEAMRETWMPWIELKDEPVCDFCDNHTPATFTDTAGNLYCNNCLKMSASSCSPASLIDIRPIAQLDNIVTLGI